MLGNSGSKTTLSRAIEASKASPPTPKTPNLPTNQTLVLQRQNSGSISQYVAQLNQQAAETAKIEEINEKTRRGSAPKRVDSSQKLLNISPAQALTKSVSATLTRMGSSGTIHHPVSPPQKQSPSQPPVSPSKEPPPKLSATADNTSKNTLATTRPRAVSSTSSRPTSATIASPASPPMTAHTGTSPSKGAPPISVTSGSNSSLPVTAPSRPPPQAAPEKASLGVPIRRPSVKDNITAPTTSPASSPATSPTPPKHSAVTNLIKQDSSNSKVQRSTVDVESSIPIRNNRNSFNWRMTNVTGSLVVLDGSSWELNVEKNLANAIIHRGMLEEAVKAEEESAVTLKALIEEAEQLLEKRTELQKNATKDLHVNVMIDIMQERERMENNFLTFKELVQEWGGNSRNITAASKIEALLQKGSKESSRTFRTTSQQFRD